MLRDKLDYPVPETIHLFALECSGRIRYFAEKGQSCFEVFPDSIVPVSRDGILRLRRYLGLQKRFEEFYFI